MSILQILVTEITTLKDVAENKNKLDSNVDKKEIADEYIFWIYWGIWYGLLSAWIELTIDSMLAVYFAPVNKA